MSETTVSYPPRPPVHHWRHFLLHPAIRNKIIHLGWLSSLVFLVVALVAAIWPAFAALIYSWRYVIAITYLVLQLAEIASEDHLRSDALIDHVLSCPVALLGLVWMGAVVFGSRLTTIECWDVTLLFTLFAWIDFIFGIWFNSAVLQAPYNRREQAVRPDH